MSPVLLRNALAFAIAAALGLAACKPAADGRSAPTATAAAPTAEQVKAESARLNAWFETQYEEQLKFSPIQLSFLGRPQGHADGRKRRRQVPEPYVAIRPAVRIADDNVVVRLGQAIHHRQPIPALQQVDLDQVSVAEEDRIPLRPVLPVTIRARPLVGRRQ